MIISRYRRYILIVTLLVLGVTLIVVDRFSENGSFQAFEQRVVEPDRIVDNGTTPPGPGATLPPDTGNNQPPIVDDPFVPPPTDPTPKPNVPIIVRPPGTTITPPAVDVPVLEPETVPDLAVNYTFLTKNISRSFKDIGQFGFSDREMVWLGEEFLRSLIRAEREGRNYIALNDFEWIALLIREAREAR